MSFTVKAMCQHGELLHRRKTAEAALKKAREMSRAGCYNVRVDGRCTASAIAWGARLVRRHRSAWPV